MKLNRILILIAAGALAAGMSRADIAPGATFTINLNDDTSSTNPDGTGGWGNGTTFNVTVNPNDINQSDFTELSDCTDVEHHHHHHHHHHWGYWGGGGGVTEVPCEDPTIQINPGGDADPIPGSFNADDSGGGYLQLVNTTGNDVNSLFIVTGNYPDSFFVNQTFNCGGTSFAFCGFEIIGTDAEVGILFADPVPEPHFGYVFLAGAGLLALYARRAAQKSRA